MNTDKTRDPIPEEFATYEEAAEFWDTHDLTDYLDQTVEVDMPFDLRERVFQIEIEPTLIAEIRKLARKRGVNAADLTNDLLRKQLARTE